MILQQRVTALRIRWWSRTRSTRCSGSGWTFCACAATAAGRRYVCDGGVFGRLTLPEDATDRGPEPLERLLSAEVLVEAAALVAVLGSGAGGAAMSALSSGGDRDRARARA